MTRDELLDLEGRLQGLSNAACDFDTSLELVLEFEGELDLDSFKKAATQLKENLDKLNEITDKLACDVEETLAGYECMVCGGPVEDGTGYCSKACYKGRAW